MAHQHRSAARRRSGRCREGLAVTELALLLPFLAMLFVIALDYSRIFYYTMTIASCARNGAIYGGQNPTNANDTTGIKTNAQKDAANLTLANVNVTSKTDSATSPTYVDVTVTYPFKTITTYPGIPSSTTISRTVRMTVTPWTPN